LKTNQAMGRRRRNRWDDHEQHGPVTSTCKQLASLRDP
jgi:hypothetical protein